jgi:hypothetical protein
MVNYISEFTGLRVWVNLVDGNAELLIDVLQLQQPPQPAQPPKN